ncbi:hypothetical protein PV328_011179 [Microctonus aethiopoides]|uniref:Uncharacterized protein n=1 Tax=Microctonus aethiopoides TaxID=144406 RepID=A0AA39C3W0_9HYME|nr:hypothetical protein PV328_011179 [Microctonus aethiopoides]
MKYSVFGILEEVLLVIPLSGNRSRRYMDGEAHHRLCIIRLHHYTQVPGLLCIWNCGTIDNLVEDHCYLNTEQLHQCLAPDLLMPWITMMVEYLDISECPSTESWGTPIC